MNQAQNYVKHLYDTFPGRVPIVVGASNGFGMVYPFVFKDSEGVPIGLVGMAWNKRSKDDLVQVYHISSFENQKGSGSKILEYLCKCADEFGVTLYVQAEPQYIDIDSSIDQSTLVNWYRSFGFKGGYCLERPPIGLA